MGFLDVLNENEENCDIAEVNDRRLLVVLNWLCGLLLKFGFFH